MGPYYYPYPYGAYQAESSLHLEVKPKEAEVFVDGYYAGIVDDYDGTFQRLRVVSGTHRISIYLPGYHTIQRDLYLEPNQTTKIRETMQPLGPGEPNDPRPTPSVPPAGVSQPPQQQPRMPGHRGGERPPAPPPPTTSEQPPLPEAESALGTLVIHVKPAGATLLIDGQRWSAPEGDEDLLVQLSEGTHKVEVRKDGYTSYAAQIDIHRGETLPLTVSLTARQQ